MGKRQRRTGVRLGSPLPLMHEHLTCTGSDPARGSDAEGPTFLFHRFLNSSPNFLC